MEASLKCPFSLFCGDFYWDRHSMSHSARDNSLHFHVPNSIFSTYYNSLDGMQNHNVVSQSNGITSGYNWYLSHTSLIISDTEWDHILCPGRLLWHVMCQITPQAKNIHCTFFGQLLQNITCMHLPILCMCRQTGTRSELGL